VAIKRTVLVVDDEKDIREAFLDGRRVDLSLREFELPSTPAQAHRARRRGAGADRHGPRRPLQV